MKITIYTLTFFLLITTNLFSQKISQLKITNEEMPKEYAITENQNCISTQACSFYKNTDMYSSFIGKVKNKEVQNFESEKDSGSIMYFEFENGFKGEGFLGGLLWGSNKKPTKEHPEKFFVKGNFLIIWSFNKGSELEKISEEKIKLLLK